MPSFIEACRCNGVRPAGIVGHRFTSRPSIVGRLLRDRRVARFIVAPAGCGKSTIAFEYASIIFGFRDMLWMDCSSPCFLRDLDGGALSGAVEQCEPAVRLVVCEDVPCLDAERASAFGSFLDGLLAGGVEVLVTCAPSADTFSHLQRDRMVLSADDLLLSDDELAELASTGTYGDRDIHAMPAALRIACLHWSDDGAKPLLDGIISEDLPQEVVSSMFVLLVLGAGDMDDVQAFLSAEKAKEACAIIARSYPFFGLDGRTAAYRAIDLPIAQLADAFGRRMAQLASGCAGLGKEALASRLADMLAERGCGERACELMAAFASKPTAAAWLIRSCRRLVAGGHGCSISLLHDTVRRSVSGVLDQLSLCKAWALYALEDMDGAAQFSKRVLRMGSSSDAQKAQALCLLVAAGDMAAAERALQRAGRLLDRLEEAVPSPADEAGLCAEAPAMLRFFEALLRMGSAAALDWQALRDALAGCDGARDAVLFCAGAYLRRLAAGEMDALAPCAEDAPDDARDRAARFAAIEEMCRFCAAAFESAPAGADWFAAAAVQQAAAVAEGRLPIGGFSLSARAASALQRSRARATEQRERYGADQRQAQAKKRAYNMTHPDPLRIEPAGAASGVPDASVPTLTVNLFGGMEVRIGGKLLEPGKLSRMKVKTLLAVLVINRGREVPRQRLAEILWPESGFDAYRRNFYSLWSQLKRSLTVAGGCPYLVRSQVGCGIDARLVASDVYDYEQVCRSLLFGVDGSGDWERLYSCVCNEYAGKLMPCEGENPTIVSLREHYHAQMVDGLIATSSRLIQRGEPRGALWFSREAARREPKREDVYISLMEAQMASDQRSAALGTYFECRRFLSEDLGIDPSSHLVGLYRSIIETEDAF